MTAHPLAPIPALGHSGFDRSATERTDPQLIEKLRADAATRVLVVRGDAAQCGADGRLHYRAPAEVPRGAQWMFLGRAGDGTALLAAAFEAGDTDASWGPLRAIGGGLDAQDGDAFVTAVSLGRWLREAAFCPACGTRLQGHSAGWARRCPSCRREHFPRTDPAIIVAVESASRPDRLLLGSNALWGANRYSCFAGFVEAGESLESAVLRELHEESGIAAGDIRYRGSQAWPYPRSLMLGFRVRALDDDRARADGDEIAAVRWFTRAEIGAALDRGGWADGRADDDRVLLPGPASIAYRLIADWYAERA
ncbi:NAD(+) diphosphatase [Microbacterium kribbense]|uniref:NAD(+) diphosphatase n=1 Tax=Microbacterium kribbense TaxID=433645 RepID=A0ABP7GE05_9MICO